MRKSKNRYFYHIFVSPGDAPAAITLNVVWMEREVDAYKLSRSMYPCISNSFPVIRTASAKNCRFHVPQPTFCFPWRRPCDYHAICCMDLNTIQCLPNASQHVPIYANCFRVIRCLSQCVSPKIAIFTTFLFPLGDAPGAITLNVVWMEREFDAYKLTRCMCPSIYNRFWDKARYWSKMVVLAQLTNVTDTQTPHVGIYRAYAYASRDKNGVLYMLTLRVFVSSWGI